MKDIDKYRGCLIGGAAGDALGYAVEFIDETSIFNRYGKNGITEYDLVNGVARISDDTHMTLFTANGTIDKPINNSKGCGGVMRVAPIGLYFETGNLTLDEIDMIGAETAAITHGHELGYIPAAGLVHIIQLISHNDDITLSDAVLDMKEALYRQFANGKHLSEQIDLINKAIALSKEKMDDLEAIRELGQGWIGEETLAIAVYCSLKYSNDFDKALIASVNHSGDSDSTGL